MIKLKQNGFSLIELSIVLFISALLLRAAIVPLPQLRDTAMRKQASLQLRQVKQALIGHVIRVGALPCPISLIELSHDVAGCQIAEGGVPAAILGLLSSINEAGAVVDPWGRPLRYALSQADHQSRGSVGLLDWSTSGEVAAIGLREVQADIRLCLGVDTRCTKQHLRADQLVAIVISDGRDNSGRGAQGENQDGDTDYALTAHSQVKGKTFDDMLTTLTRGDIAYWLLRGHWLGSVRPY